MSIGLSELSDEDYKKLRYEIIANVEGEKQIAYIDSKGYVTIGTGFNLYEPGVRDLVLSELFGIREDEHGEIHQQLSAIFDQ
ncbi:hypothetical protein [Teredinibacter franksiae]|uniref:hypothetical protein n=1 Tax=Teredinibacter franksiae TaxID=2761453 RepID=UPI0016257085|nr:hypothetical protein [Teredinibacter franksiae]